MTRDRWIGWAISVVLFALTPPACKEKTTSHREKRSDHGTLTANANQVLDELGSLETKRDVTCWTSFRQLDWFIAEKSYSEFGTLAKIAAIKGLVRAVWVKASAAAKGGMITAAELAATVKLPVVEIPAERRGDLATFANDVGLENFTNYQKTAEHWRVLLSVLQDEIDAGGDSPLVPMEPEALRQLADMATTLSLMLLKESGAAAEADHSETVEGVHVQTAYRALEKAHGLENPERPADRLDAKAVEVELQPMTRRLIEGKITALNVFNKTTGSITSDLNKVTRVPLTEEAVDHFMKLVQSFDHFVTSGIDPMQADNYLSDGSFATTRFARKPYLDELHVQNAVMQLFPHHMMPNGDILVRFEPNPGPVIGTPRQAFELKLLDHEQNGVRDSAAQWIALKTVFGEKAFAIDPFAAEYLTEVNSMMLTMFVRRAEEIAKGLGANQIDLAVAKRVQDGSMVMVPPVRETPAAWTAERIARKKELLSAYGDALFRDVTAAAGLPTSLPQFEGKGLEPLDAHVGPDPSKMTGHIEPPDTSKVTGHTEPPDTSKVTGHTEPPIPGHVEPDMTSVQGHFNLQRIMGGGIAVGDVNGDRYPDLFIAGEGMGRLYLNRGRAAPGTFTDVSEKWGVPAGLDDSHGSIFFDIEGDGDLDLLVLRSDHPTLLLRQDKGKLTDAAEALKLVPHRGAHAATAFDYDRDGDLDLFIGYYGSHESNTGKARNLPSLDGRNGSPDQLWRQEADGTFTDVAAQAGVADTGWTLAVGTFDYGMDGDLDLVLANDFGPDTFFENEGDGTFADITTATDTGDRGSGMNVDFGDVNRDGRWDIYVTNIDMFSKRIKVIFPRDESTIKVDESLVRAMQYLSGNKLYVATGDPARPFAHDEGARMEPGDRGWGWDAGFFDVENDGDDDLYLCNGWIDGSYAGNQKNQMFINDAGFLYLAPPASPEAFAGNSRAAAQVDLDLDGDVDLVVNNFRQAPRVLENVQKAPGRWIRLRLAGSGKNPLAIGAQVSIRAGETTILRQLVTGRGYLGQADPAIHAGLGAARTVDVTITWPDGTKSEHPKLASNREHRLSQKK
jgi:hypothetical protein